MSKLIKKAFVGSSLFLPFLVLAQDATSITTLLGTLTGYINDFIPFIIGIAVLVFIWGLLKYFMSGGDDEAKKAAISLIIWGIIFIFVMVSVWGLVNILTGSFSFNETAPTVPVIPGGTI